jgi:GntR family transcriptional regulator, rspAB operon transcriptional repressor
LTEQERHPNLDFGRPLVYQWPGMNPLLYRAIKEQIRNQPLNRGESLSERKLARRFKVSRSPVRAVLKTLEQEGFIKVVPQKGAFVDSLALDDIREIFELREALDIFAVRKAAVSMSSPELRSLAKKFGSLTKRGQKVSFEEMRDAWSELFQAVVRSLNNSRFSKIYSDLFDQVETVRRFSTSSPERIAEAISLGRDLIKTLLDKNPDRAEKILRLHRQKSREAILKGIS